MPSRRSAQAPPPGCLPLGRSGSGRIESVGGFARLLLVLAGGNALSIGLGLATYNLLVPDSLQQLTWSFFHPIVVSNILMSFLFVPPLFDVAATLGASVKWQPFDGKALGRYRPAGKEIVLADQTSLAFYHELLHHLDCQTQPIRPGRLAEAELVAEFGGSVLCALQGINGYEASSYRYLQMYAEGKESEAVLRSIMAIAARVETLVGIVLDAAELSPAIDLAPALSSSAISA